MSSVVCQGQRSCLKPRLIEPIVLRHKLSPPISIAIPLPEHHHPLEEISHETNHIEEEQEDTIIDLNNSNKVTKNDNVGGWTFLNALANPTQFNKQVTDQKTEKVYVHPMAKSFSSSLSSKSLEMCTEGLGCETGSDICENNDEFSSISWEKERLLAMRKSRSLQLSKKVVPAASSSFPPPLTSISGSDGVRVRPHREGGRLVIKAVSVSSSGTNFQAERTNGRLTLSLVKDCSMKCQFEMAAEVEEVEKDTKIDEEEEAKYNDEEKDMKIDVDDDEEDDEAEEEVLEEDEEEEDGDFVGDMGGNVGKAGGGNGNANGNGEFPRPSRCKEGRSGNKRLSDWRSFWVPIS